jgi:hypothetical protein
VEALSPEDAILSLLAERAAGKTICPSEAARRLDETAWRTHMDAVRTSGVILWRQGRITVLQKGEPVDPRHAVGPIRYGRPG